MRITFTLVQMDTYAISECRYYGFYDVARSYFGVPVGEYWGPQDLRVFLDNELTHLSSGDASTEIAIMRGVTYNVALIKHAILVHETMNDFKVASQRLKDYSELSADTYDEIVFKRDYLDVNGNPFKRVSSLAKALKKYLCEVEH